MLWKCPACQLSVTHHDSEDRPRRRVRYRCHVCRLDLVLDSHTQRLTAAPMDDAEPPAAEPKTPSPS